MLDLFLFPERIARAPTIGAVCAELVALTGPRGFPVYVIGALPHPEAPYPGNFMVTNWPLEFQTAYFERRFGDRDPTLRALAGAARAFTIAELRAGRLGFMPSAAEREVLDYAAGLGYPQGLMVPVWRAQGYAGVAGVCGPGPEPDALLRSQLQFLLEHAHDRLRALWVQPPGAAAALTRRETEVLGLARRGLSDAGIAAQAGIAVRTVRFHFENARRKLAARSRPEAIAIAVSRHLLPL